MFSRESKPKPFFCRCYCFFPSKTSCVSNGVFHQQFQVTILFMLALIEGYLGGVWIQLKNMFVKLDHFPGYTWGWK